MSSNEEVVAKSEVTRLQQRIVELERALGRKTLENDILRETIEKTDQKNRPCDCRCFRRKVVCENRC
ncbi:hypothetical protein [Ktedonobacter racemifer]|uniref:hypothetical protein n=1 Tax=Ktedonobacter racemifer TaxID=363277 RepID=UPI0012F93C34